jgi:hypothetical protein
MNRNAPVAQLDRALRSEAGPQRYPIPLKSSLEHEPQAIFERPPDRRHTRATFVRVLKARLLGFPLRACHAKIASATMPSLWLKLRAMWSIVYFGSYSERWGAHRRSLNAERIRLAKRCQPLRLREPRSHAGNSFI